MIQFLFLRNGIGERMMLDDDVCSEKGVKCDDVYNIVVIYLRAIWKS
jgi:hypothetical protein